VSNSDQTPPSDLRNWCCKRRGMLGLRAFELHESSFVLAGPAVKGTLFHSQTRVRGRSVAFTVGRETARNHSTTTLTSPTVRILLESGLNMVTPIQLSSQSALIHGD